MDPGAIAVTVLTDDLLIERGVLDFDDSAGSTSRHEGKARVICYGAQFDCKMMRGDCGSLACRICFYETPKRLSHANDSGACQIDRHPDHQVRQAR